VITVTEVLTQPFIKSRHELVQKYKYFLEESSDFMVYPIDFLIAEKAASLRAKYMLRTPDALQIATAIENNATLLITNDDGFKRVKEDELEILVLKDFLTNK
jgi:predicted nucleic acid-binding protein